MVLADHILCRMAGRLHVWIANNGRAFTERKVWTCTLIAAHVYRIIDGRLSGQV